MNGWSDSSISLDPPPVKNESPPTPDCCDSKCTPIYYVFRHYSVSAQKSAGEETILLSQKNRNTGWLDNVMKVR